jgi:hypothetical protein
LNANDLDGTLRDLKASPKVFVSFRSSLWRSFNGKRFTPLRGRDVMVDFVDTAARVAPSKIAAAKQQAALTMIERIGGELVNLA